MSKEEFVNACLAYQKAKKDAIEEEYRTYRMEMFARINAERAKNWHRDRRGRKSYE